MPTNAGHGKSSLLGTWKLRSKSAKSYPAFTREQTKFIIRRRRELDDRFTKLTTKCGPLWLKITEELKDAFPDLPHDSASVSKRYANMLTRYKEELSKAENGEVEPSTWTYYRAFHDDDYQSEPDEFMAATSTTTGNDIDVSTLLMVNSGSEDDHAEVTIDPSEETQFWMLLPAIDEVEELAVEEGETTAVSKSNMNVNRGKRNSVPKERHRCKCLKLESDLQSFRATTKEDFKDLRSLLETAEINQAKRDEETRAFRKEALQVGKMLAEGLKAVAGVFSVSSTFE